MDTDEKNTYAAGRFFWSGVLRKLSVSEASDQFFLQTVNKLTNHFLSVNETAGYTIENYSVHTDNFCRLSLKNQKNVGANALTFNFATQQFHLNSKNGSTKSLMKKLLV